MKKVISFLCVTMSILLIAVNVFAEVEKAGRLSAQVLSELFIFDESDIDKIEVIYPGDGDPYGCYVDKSEFFDIAETIQLIPNKRINEMEENNGVLIVAVNKNDERNSVWLDNKGRVGCNTFETSSSTITQYDISRDDYIRMYAFLPEEATAHIPLENPMKKYVVATSLFAGLIFAAAFVSAYCVKKKRG